MTSLSADGSAAAALAVTSMAAHRASKVGSAAILAARSVSAPLMTAAVVACSPLAEASAASASEARVEEWTTTNPMAEVNWSMGPATEPAAVRSSAANSGE